MATWTPHPQASKSAPNYVIDQIRDALFKKELNPGDRMPTETELVELFGVSRGSVRQAMKALETMGVLTIRPGDGTYVNTEVSANSFNPLLFALLISRASAKTFADARYALERDIYELILANENSLTDLIPKLENNIRVHEELIESGANPKELAKNDQAFHMLISESCGNLLLQIVYNYVMDAFSSSIEDTTALQNSVSSNVTIRDHTMILDALKARSHPEAKKAAKGAADRWYELLQLKNP